MEDLENTKYTITTTDINIAKKLVKAEDMAMFIWELVNNGWREFKHTDYDYTPAWDKIRRLISEYNLEEICEIE